MEYKDYYKIMGVERDATQDQIKRAYCLIGIKGLNFGVEVMPTILMPSNLVTLLEVCMDGQAALREGLTAHLIGEEKIATLRSSLI